MDWELASFSIGETVTIDDLQFMSDNVVVLESEKLFLPEFIPFQYGDINPESKSTVHIGVFKALSRHGLSYPYLTLTKGYHVTLKDKDKDKDKAKDKAKAKAGESAERGVVSPVDAGNTAGAENTPDFSAHVVDQDIVARIGKLFGRKSPLTCLDQDKLDVLKPTDEEMSLIEEYHAAEPKFCRQSVRALLDNWRDEVDRACKRKANPSSGKPVRSIRDIQDIIKAKKSARAKLDMIYNFMQYGEDAGRRRPVEFGTWKTLCSEIRDLEKEMAGMK